MNPRVGAVIALACVFLAAAFVAPIASAAPPQPYTLWGLARQSDGITALPQGTRITGWVDGVDYSNGTSVFSTGGSYDVDTYGDWMSGPADPDTPERKEGGNVGDEIMYVAGDLTTTGSVFTAKKFWTAGDRVNENIQLSSGLQAGLLKVGRIITQPSDGLSQYVYLCNPTGSAIDGSGYYLQKDVLGSFNGPTHAITGIAGPFGGILYVNLTSWSPASSLTQTGDNLKLVWNNPGTNAFGSSDVIVDRVEFNRTGGTGTLFWEPGNTIMTDAAAPGAGQETVRGGLDNCVDTNSNSADFSLRAATPRPSAGNTAPTVSATAPAGGEDWTSGTVHTIQWTQNDAEDATLTVAIDLSVDNGATWPFAVFGGSRANGPNTVPWTVTCANSTIARIRVQVFDTGALNGVSVTNQFTVDCAAPTLLSTIPANGATGVPVDISPILTFSESMNQVATQGAVSFAPVVTFTSSWAGGQVLTLDPTASLAGNTMYTVTVGCAAEDDSDTGNALAACPRTFSFTTTAAAAAPVVDLTVPDGGQVWSGSSIHTVTWTMSDTDTPGNLNVDLHYSTNGGSTWNTIFTNQPRGQGTNNYLWTLPCVTTTQARVRATASDGAQSTADMSAADFTIDCTRPTVLSTVPSNSAQNVGLGDTVVILFSEPMDQTPTNAAIGFNPAVTGITFFWSAADTVSISHNDFVPCTTYTATVATSAEDLSDPGLTMASPATWSFSTACGPSVQITAPLAGAIWSGGTSHQVRFIVTDSDASVFVWVNVTVQTTQTVSQSTRATGIEHTVAFTVEPFDTTTATIRVTAQDPTGIDGFNTVTFQVDATGPMVTSTVPTTGATNVVVTAPFSVSFSEPMDPTTTEASISLAPGVGAFTYTWGGNTVTVNHAQALLVSTQYTLTVSTVARDLSDPGNPLASPYTVTFTTSATGAVVADAGGPYAGQAGQAIRLNGQGSTGAIDNWTWEIIYPGGATTAFAYGERPLVTLPTQGTYQITLTVRDSAGNTDEDATTASISSGAGGNFLADYWWLFVVLIAAVVLALFFLMGKRRKKEEPERRAMAPEDVEVTPRSPPKAPPPARPAPPAAMPAKGKPSTRECPSCGTIVDSTDTECFMCGAKL